jgi:hypothetical protein
MASSKGQVQVTVINCASDFLREPIIAIREFGVPGSPVPEPLTAAAVQHTGRAGVYDALIALSPGNYTVTAASAHCKSPGSISVSIFPDLTRHIIALTNKECCSIPTLYNSGLGVTVPDGASVDLLATSKWNFLLRQGNRDDGVTYFDDLPPDRYTLEVRVPSATACISVIVPSTLNGYQRFVKLSMADIVPLLYSAQKRFSPRKCSNP